MTSLSQLINARRVFNGPEDKYRGVRPLKYPWTETRLKTMERNTWSPDTVDLKADAREIYELSDGQRDCFYKSLAFLSNLDAIQLDNLSQNIASNISTHEIKRCINRQIWEEEVHVRSYSQIVEAVSPDPMLIYGMYETNPVLSAKNSFIVEMSERIKKEGATPHNMALAIDANIALEGIYFFTGFLNIYAIGRASKKMNGSMDMIKYIQRDEITHLDLFGEIYRSYRAENPRVYTKKLQEERIELYRAACDLESAWGRHTISGGVLGLTDPIVNGFVQNITDDRMQGVGLPAIYNAKETVPWFKEYSSLESGNTNTFERRNKDYQVAGALEW